MDRLSGRLSASGRDVTLSGVVWPMRSDRRQRETPHRGSPRTPCRARRHGRPAPRVPFGGSRHACNAEPATGLAGPERDLSSPCPSRDPAAVQAIGSPAHPAPSNVLALQPLTPVKHVTELTQPDVHCLRDRPNAWLRATRAPRPRYSHKGSPFKDRLRTGNDVRDPCCVPSSSTVEPS